MTTVLLDLEREYDAICNEFKIASKDYNRAIQQAEMLEGQAEKRDELRDLEIKSCALKIELLLKNAKEIKQEIDLHKNSNMEGQNGKWVRFVLQNML